MMERSRQRKLKQFLPCYAGELALDVGVSSNEWTGSINFIAQYFQNSDYSDQYVGLGIQDMGALTSNYNRLNFVQYAGGKFPFRDQSFEWVFSNAVLEHVGGRVEQLHFLREMLRVGRNVFFTTPNRYFPVELHTNVPLLHILLSKVNFDRYLSRIGKSFATGGYMNLLSGREILSLTKEATQNSHINCKLIRNRVLGFTCTFTVILSNGNLDSGNTY